MRLRNAIAIISAVLVGASAFAEDAKPLTIGNKVPAFPVDGYVKGKNITNFEPGKVYVVEFWATWCGPCISSMPHLSDMADKFKGKADFISVNTWDYSKKADGKESVAEHKARVQDWVSKNDQKMRYNIAFDDDKDTISTTWMRAAGQNGIPCAFIVKDGTVNWIGHPMSMDKPLEEIVNGTFDVEGFKVDFEKKAKAARDAQEAQRKLMADMKAGNKEAIDQYIASGSAQQTKGNRVMQVIQMSATSNPTMAFDYFKSYAGKIEGVDAYNWCGAARMLVKGLKGDDQAQVVKMSEECANMSKPDLAAIAYIYHAGVLYNAGNKEGALAWGEKAKGAVKDYPETGRDSVVKFIEQQIAGFK
jgi:thiol-disulfide isomerase/thioredoxin